MVFFIDHKMAFLTSQIKQKIGESKNFNLKNNSNCKYKYINNKLIINIFLPTHPPTHP